MRCSPAYLNRFGTAKRDGLGDTSRNAPGPGAYNFRSSFEQDGTGTTLVPRRPMSAGGGGPGPGAYNPKDWDKQRVPTVRIGTASRDGLGDRSGSPGPGSYDLSLGSKNRAPTHV